MVVYVKPGGRILDQDTGRAPLVVPLGRESMGVIRPVEVHVLEHGNVVCRGTERAGQPSRDRVVGGRDQLTDVVEQRAIVPNAIEWSDGSHQPSVSLWRDDAPSRVSGKTASSTSGRRTLYPSVLADIVNCAGGYVPSAARRNAWKTAHFAGAGDEK